MEPTPSYKQGLTYICVADCGAQITVDSVGQGGPISCCGQPMRRGRVLAVAPRGTGERGGRLPTAYRLVATEEDFDAVAAQGDKLVVAEFTAPWCGACKAMDPILDELAITHAGKLVLVGGCRPQPRPAGSPGGPFCPQSPLPQARGHQGPAVRLLPQGAHRGGFATAPERLEWSQAPSTRHSRVANQQPAAA